jgi:hypothetical protein
MKYFFGIQFSILNYIRIFVKNFVFIMMTKQQHINYWTNTAVEDWTTVEVLFSTKRYLHCLFWAHLVLEKLAKAHWVKTHEDDIPPKVHNIILCGY